MEVVVTVIYGLALFMALAGSPPVVAEVELGFSNGSGPPPPATHKHTVFIYTPPDFQEGSELFFKCSFCKLIS